MENMHLKKEYFDQIRNGIKQYEFRERTPYWEKRPKLMIRAGSSGEGGMGSPRKQ